MLLALASLTEHHLYALAPRSQPLQEFFDHTYDDHFGCPLPMYLPRKVVFQYLLKRVTKNSPGIFNDVKFNTSVQSVKYNDAIGKFVIQTVNNKTGTVSTEYFDKCIWAGGNNGRPYIPKSIESALSFQRRNL